MQFAECSKTVNHIEHRENFSVTSVSPVVKILNFRRCDQRVRTSLNGTSSLIPCPSMIV